MLLSPATYAVSVSSGLSVAEPKYFLPAALAATARPTVEVDDGAVVEPGAVEAGAVVELGAADPFEPGVG